MFCMRLFVVYCCLLACLTLVGDFAWVGGFRWFLWFCLLVVLIALVGLQVMLVRLFGLLV